MADVKCVLVGDGIIGKTTLILTYIRSGFPEEYDPITVLENYTAQVVVDGKQVNLELWDVAGRYT